MSGHLHCQRPAASPNPERNQVSSDLHCLKPSGIAELTGTVLLRMGLGEEKACHQYNPARGVNSWLGRISEESYMLVSFHFGCTLRHPHGFGGVRGPGR